MGTYMKEGYYWIQHCGCVQVASVLIAGGIQHIDTKNGAVYAPFYYLIDGISGLSPKGFPDPVGE